MHIKSDILKLESLAGLLLQIIPTANVSITAPASSGQIALKSEVDVKADLVDGKIPASQLPASMDDILIGRYINSTTFNDLSSVPYSPLSNKIYLDNISSSAYRWSGSIYLKIPGDIVIGETSSSAYRGDRGKIAYDHSNVKTGNPHNVTAAQVGLGNVNNTADASKPVSNATQSALDTKLDRILKYTSKGADFTLSLVDMAFDIIEVTSSSDIIITVPAGLTDNKIRVVFVRMGTGNVTFLTSGTTIKSADSCLSLRSQYSSATLTVRSTNDFVLVGDLKTIE